MKAKICIKIVALFILLQNFQKFPFAPYYNGEKPLTEFSMGFKVVAGDFEYSSLYLETSGFTPGHQPMVLNDSPVKLFTIRGNLSCFNFTASADILTIPLKSSDYKFTNLYFGEITSFSNKNPLYPPFHFGFYSSGTIVPLEKRFLHKAYFAKRISEGDNV